MANTRLQLTKKVDQLVKWLDQFDNNLHRGEQDMIVEDFQRRLASSDSLTTAWNNFQDAVNRV